jgi:hypothetical protein
MFLEGPIQDFGYDHTSLVCEWAAHFSRKMVDSALLGWLHSSGHHHVSGMHVLTSRPPLMSTPELLIARIMVVLVAELPRFAKTAEEATSYQGGKSQGRLSRSTVTAR